jgi:hypothetical protein
MEMKRVELICSFMKLLCGVTLTVQILMCHGVSGGISDQFSATNLPKSNQGVNAASNKC